MNEMSKTVLYADPRTDITEAVILNLNDRYKKAGGVAPKSTTVKPAGASTAVPPAAPSPRPGGGD
jgi:hypothetical protein